MYRYGLLKSSELNLGDEIQTTIVRGLLPKVDEYVDGCYLHKVKSDPKMKLVIHGCFNSNSGHWPPSDDIEPLFISFFIGEYTEEAYTRPKSVEYFKRYAPIGCRDLHTLEVMQSTGIDSYFSGCITSLLQPYEGLRSSEIILADLEPHLIGLVKKIVPEVIEVHHGEGLPWERISSRLYVISPLLLKAVKASRVHRMLGLFQQRKVRNKTNNTYTESRMRRAEDLLYRYARAKLVITSRLHAALPCIAFDTPVIFVHRNITSQRFSGLLDCIPHYSLEEFRNALPDIDFDHPKPNKTNLRNMEELILTKCQEFLQNKEEDGL